jgi:hypothetical protein
MGSERSPGPARGPLRFVGCRSPFSLSLPLPRRARREVNRVRQRRVIRMSADSTFGVTCGGRMSALLRQPGGFEGSDCPPVSERNASALDQPTVRQVFRNRRGSDHLTRNDLEAERPDGREGPSGPLCCADRDPGAPTDQGRSSCTFERSPPHTNSSCTSRRTLAIKTGKSGSFLIDIRATPRRSPDLYLLRAVPSLRSAPGRTSNKTTRRPRSHTFPPSDCTKYRKISYGEPAAWRSNVNFVSYLTTPAAADADAATASRPIAARARSAFALVPSDDPTPGGWVVQIPEPPPKLRRAQP